VNSASDLGLYLVERLCGHQVAVETARALLLDMPRPSQSSYAILPLLRLHSDEQVRKAEAYLSANFHRNVPTDELAARVGMSGRNLVCRFEDATGARPGAHIQMLRRDGARDAGGRRRLDRAGRHGGRLRRHGVLSTTVQAIQRDDVRRLS